MDFNHAIDQIFDEELRQLTELRKMAANPRLVGLMRQIVAAADGPTTPTPAAAHKMSVDRDSQPQDVLMIGKPAKNARFLPNGLTDSTLATIKSLGRPFTIPALVDQMQDSGYKFTSGKPRVAVAGVIKSLLKKGWIRLVESGVGSVPHTYELVRSEGVEN